MAQLTITASDAVMASLRAYADATGRSVEEVAEQAIANGLKMDRAGLLAIADKARALQPRPLDDDSVEIIRRLRDAS